jgi:hypothetical protein
MKNDFGKLFLFILTLFYLTISLSCSQVNVKPDTNSLSSDKSINSFGFVSVSNVTASISGNNVLVTVPIGTDITNLKAIFTIIGKTVKVGSVIQVSGVSANNFTNPVTYTLAAEDGTTADYIVKVQFALSGLKDITAFNFTVDLNRVSGITSDKTGTINGSAISITVLSGTNLTNLISTFTTTGKSVKVGTITQVSGVTANDFTNPVTYTVTAEDGTTKSFVVTVTVLSNNSNLSNLVLNGNGSFTLNLSPSFSSSTISYNSGWNSSGTINMTPTLSNSSATMTVSIIDKNSSPVSVSVNNGIYSFSYSLALASYTITITVTAQDGISTQTYTINFQNLS